MKLTNTEPKKKSTEIEILKEIKKEYDNKSSIILKLESRKNKENQVLLDIKYSFNRYINNIQNINLNN